MLIAKCNYCGKNTEYIGNICSSCQLFSDISTTPRRQKNERF